MSSKSGSSDVLAALGVDLTAGLAQQRQALDEAGIAFLFAPAYHGAMRHVGPVRAEIGFRTVFNLLGPLSNPAGAKRQVMGVYDPRLLEPLAEVLGRLGATRAWTVHGQGLDELTTTGPTEVAEWKDGAVRRFTVTPEDAGLPRADIDSPARRRRRDNAAALRALLAGATGPYRDIVLLNAAAALVVADRAADLKSGVALAAAAIDDGKAADALAGLARITSTPPPSRRASHDRRPRPHRRLQARGRRRPQGRARRRPRSKRSPLIAGMPRGFRAALERRADRRPPRPDRRDQEGQPVQGPDPPRLRPARPGPRL